MVRRFRPIALLFLLVVPALSAPRAVDAQQGASPSMARLVTGAAIGATTGVLLVGPAGPSIVGSDAVTIGALTGVGLLAGLVPLPRGTRFTSSVGAAFFGMSDLLDQYQFIKEEEAHARGTEEPGLGAEWVVHVDVPVREHWWAGLEVAVLNDAASVTSSEVVCDAPGDCSLESRLVAESTAQSLVVAATARRRLGSASPIFARLALGAGLAGLSTPLVSGLGLLEGLDETSTTVAPYGEVALEAGGLVEGGGPDVQLGFRVHPTGDFDYSPLGRSARGSGPLDFGGFFARLGWSF